MENDKQTRLQSYPLYLLSKYNFRIPKILFALLFLVVITNGVLLNICIITSLLYLALELLYSLNEYKKEKSRHNTHSVEHSLSQQANAKTKGVRIRHVYYARNSNKYVFENIFEAIDYYFDNIFLIDKPCLSLSEFYSKCKYVSLEDNSEDNPYTMNHHRIRELSSCNIYKREIIEGDTKIVYLSKVISLMSTYSFYNINKRVN